MEKTGFAFHCHHDTLFEYVTDYDERVRYIKEDKPEREQELRLKLFKIIPDDRLPTKLVKAGTAYVKARKACDKARETYDKAGETCVKAGTAYVKAGTACVKAWEAYGKARGACVKAGEAYDKAWEAYKPEIEALHKELCPGCPWDGKTIFPKGD